MTDLLLISLIVGAGFVLGFAVGRWWAVALALLWLPAAAVLHDPEGEINLLGGLVLTLLITVPLQAAGVALGVVARRTADRRRRTSREAPFRSI